MREIDREREVGSIGVWHSVARERGLCAFYTS